MDVDRMCWFFSESLPETDVQMCERVLMWTEEGLDTNEVVSFYVVLCTIYMKRLQFQPERLRDLHRAMVDMQELAAHQSTDDGGLDLALFMTKNASLIERVKQIIALEDEAPLVGLPGSSGGV